MSNNTKKKIVRKKKEENVFIENKEYKLKEKENKTETEDSEINSNSIKRSDKMIEIKEKKILENELVNPYISMELTAIIELEHIQLNNELYHNLKKNLIKKVEGKCNRHGYVIKVQKITDYNTGYMLAEDFTSTCRYIIKYQGLICVPIKNTIIVAVISKKVENGKFIIAQSGPINIIFKISPLDINKNNFVIDNNVNIKSLKTGKNLQIGDYIKINIISVKFYIEDESISCMGNLIDIANEEEVFKYFEKNISKSKLIDEDRIKNNNIIEYNDDDMTTNN